MSEVKTTLNQYKHNFQRVNSEKRKKDETKIFLNGQSQSQSQPQPQPQKEILLNAKTDLTLLDPKLVSYAKCCDAVTLIVNKFWRKMER